MPELIIILLVLLGLIAAPIIIVVVVLAAKRSSGPPPAPPQIPGIESRLAEIESLRTRSIITDEEYQEKRKQIIGDL